MGGVFQLMLITEGSWI